MLALFFSPLSVLGLRRLQAAAVFCGEKAGASPTWLQCAACFLRFPPPPFFLKFAPAQLLRPPSVTLSPSPSQAVVASVYIYCLFFSFLLCCMSVSLYHPPSLPPCITPFFTSLSVPTRFYLHPLHPAPCALATLHPNTTFSSTCPSASSSPCRSQTGKPVCLSFCHSLFPSRADMTHAG